MIKEKRVRSGLKRLPSVEVLSSNLKITDSKGFIGDRATKRAFFDMIDDLRDAFAKIDADPFDKPTDELGKSEVDAMLFEGDALAAGLVHSAIEEFAQTLAVIINRFREEEGWEDVERIAVGGGFRDSRCGEIAIGRTTAILQLQGVPVELVPIRNHPDEAALIGAAQLVPSDDLTHHDSMLAVDIGGSSIRAGLVKLSRKRPLRMDKLSVRSLLHWEYSEENHKPQRDEIVEHLAGLLERLAEEAQEKERRLSPIVGIACPGMIDARGNIRDGAQNLPGDWEAEDFNLPAALHAHLPEIAGENSQFVLHNDAVVQGLSEIESMRDVKTWAIVTIGTGLGNAVFLNRPKRKRTKE